MTSQTGGLQFLYVLPSVKVKAQSRESGTRKQRFSHSVRRVSFSGMNSQAATVLLTEKSCLSSFFPLFLYYNSKVFRNSPKYCQNGRL